MTPHSVGAIRNLAFVGHGAAGKTSLVDSLLHKAGAVPRRGSVDDGTSVSDFDDEEHKRHFSIDTSVLHAHHDGNYLQILDAPGYPDFIGAALGALNAVETAVVVVNAAHGVEVNARRMFRAATDRNLVRIVVINKLDADNIIFKNVVDAIKQSFSPKCVLLNAPVGLGADFKSVVDLLHRPGPVTNVPINLAESRTELLDAITESDDALMEKYMTEGALTDDELAAALPNAVAKGFVIPILCTAAKKDIGVDELLALLPKLSVSPDAAPPKMAAGDTAIVADPAGPFLGQIFKSVNDKFVGHLSFIRVLRGKLKDHSHVHNLRSGKPAHLGAILRVQGKTHENVTEASPGDIVAIAKVDDLHIGDTLASDANAPAMPKPTYPVPMFGLAVEPKARGDEQKISVSLHKIADEDPTFQMSRDAQTKELVITGVSQLHLDVVQHRLKRRYDLEILTHEPKVAYRETITSPAEADHRHRKQSGGRGQFGEVHLRIYPIPREIHTEADLLEQFANKDRFEKMRSAHYDPVYNFAFIDHVVGGTIPTQFMPAVEKGCKELLDRGALAGYRLQDVAVEVYFGKDHAVDSSEAAFKTAGRLAFKKAVLAAKPVLLEPIVDLEVTFPQKYTGAILGDLNTKRARVDHQDSLPGDLSVIHAKIPLAEVTRYAAALGSITQGLGSYSMALSHYDLVPPNVQQQIVAKSTMAADEDE